MFSAMSSTESSPAFIGNENSSTNVFGNYQNSTTVSTDTASSRSNYYVIDESVMDSFRKALVGGVVPPMCAFGIVGNILALIILFRRKPIRSTTIVLIAIAIADLAFIAATIINCTLLLISTYYPENAKEITMKFINPFSVYLGPLPGRISNWLVALVSLERLVAVTRPLKVKQICTKRFMMTLSIATPLTIAILTCPKLWLYEVREVTLPDGNVTKTIALGVIGRQKQLFEVYYLVSESLLRFVPMGVIMVANVIIIVVTCVQAKWRRQNQQYTMGDQQSTDERQITKTLLTVTCVFIVCLSPATIARLMVLFDANSTYYKYSSNIYSLLSLIGLLTETVNSSINFVIYVTMNSAYRQQLYLICGKTLKKKATHDNVFKTVTGSNTPVNNGPNSDTHLSSTDSSTTDTCVDIYM